MSFLRKSVDVRQSAGPDDAQESLLLPFRARHGTRYLALKFIWGLLFSQVYLGACEEAISILNPESQIGNCKLQIKTRPLLTSAFLVRCRPGPSVRRRVTHPALADSILLPVIASEAKQSQLIESPRLLRSVQRPDFQRYAPRNDNSSNHKSQTNRLISSFIFLHIYRRIMLVFM